MVQTKDIVQGGIYHLHSITLSEQDIINFANMYDPLAFHTNKEVAMKSWFKGLIASGPHPFNVFYKEQWIPLFGHSVVCGLELNNWKFLKPVYADQEIGCKIQVLNKMDNIEKGVTAIQWGFDIFNQDKQSYQTVDMTVLHRLNN